MKKAKALRRNSLAAFDGSSLTDATLRPASQLCLLPPVSEASPTAAFVDVPRAVDRSVRVGLAVQPVEFGDRSVDVVEIEVEHSPQQAQAGIQFQDLDGLGRPAVGVIG